jgi:hypothetical protein
MTWCRVNQQLQVSTHSTQVSKVADAGEDLVMAEVMIHQLYVT